jgi:hypothetical protein
MRITPNDPDSYMVLGYVYTLFDRQPQASESYQQAIQRYQQAINAHLAISTHTCTSSKPIPELSVIRRPSSH